DYLLGIRINDGARIALAILGKDSVCGGVIHNRIRVSPSSNLGEHIEGLKIKDGNFVLTAIADKSDAEVGGYRDAVDPRRIWNIADNFARVRVQHGNVSCTSHVNTTSIGINGDVVPSAAARNVHFLYNLEALRGRRICGYREAADHHHDCNCERSAFRRLHSFSSKHFRGRVSTRQFRDGSPPNINEPLIGSISTLPESLPRLDGWTLTESCRPT